MSFSTSALPLAANAEPSTFDVEKLVARYAPPVRPRVRAVAVRHVRLAQLAGSFPVLLFALAMPRPGFDPAGAAAHVVDGTPLHRAAAAAGVPFWLRRFPVSMLTTPLPVLPDGEMFRRRIANHLPHSPKFAQKWLQAVAEAALWGHELLAVWTAREIVRDAKAVGVCNILQIGVWAWFSQRPDAFAYSLIETPWRPAMRFGAAVAASESWRNRLSLYVTLGETAIGNMWLRPDCVRGFDFVPLDSASALTEEAAAMSNCVDTYGYSLAHNQCRLWSMRWQGERVATLRVAMRHREPLLSIVELRGARNADTSAEVWLAAREWLHRHDVLRIDTTRIEWDKAPINVAAWRRLWRPYWLAKRAIPVWLPLTPTARDVAAL